MKPTKKEIEEQIKKRDAEKIKQLVNQEIIKK